MTILPGIRDRKLNSGYRGEVVAFDGHTKARLAFVYGKTLREMRARKRVVSCALNKLYLEKLEEKRR